MVTLHEILHLLNHSDFLASLDLEDAYFHIPIHPKHRKFLRFCVAGTHYQFKVLPLGLQSAPRVFTKCLAPVAAFLWLRGVQIFPYLDDWLVKASSLLQVSEDILSAYICFALWA